MSYCRNCGAQLSAEAAFCPKCGQVAKSLDSKSAVPEMETADLTAPSPRPSDVKLDTAVPGRAPERSNKYLIVLWAFGGLLILASVVAALYFTGALEDMGLAPDSSTTVSTTTNASGTKDSDGEDMESSGDPEDGELESEELANTLTAEESYELLLEHYSTLWTLHTEIGVANTDGTYGGTGFAYDVFNPKIGNPDYKARTVLVTECQAMIDKIALAQGDLEGLALEESYFSQREDMLALYELLAARVQAMLGAASIAVNDPDEEAWRPTLSPVSVDSRKQFEVDYPEASPIR